ncbi:MAG TPA: hypothetical protein VIL35_11515 [Vicinamibacterales bacterium]
MSQRIAPTCPARVLQGAVALLVCAGAATGSACAKRVVAAPREVPPLAVPVVPPRLVGPVVVEDDRPEPVAEAPEPAPAPARPARPAPRTADAGARPEGGGSAEGNGKADGENASAQPAEPRLLRTPETANDSEAVRKVRDILDRTEQNLTKVNYAALSSNAREQHDTARRFIIQADAALKARSLTFALYLADKAEKLSNSLLNR